MGKNSLCCTSSNSYSWTAWGNNLYCYKYSNHLLDMVTEETPENYVDAKWHPMTDPPKFTYDVLLWKGWSMRHDGMVRAFYEKGIWHRIRTFYHKEGIDSLEIKGEELAEFKYWLEIAPPFEFRKQHKKTRQDDPQFKNFKGNDKR